MRTESREETLGGSLLSHMGQSPSQTDLREAFCRDIDASSFEFNKLLLVQYLDLDLLQTEAPAEEAGSW